MSDESMADLLGRVARAHGCGHRPFSMVQEIGKSGLPEGDLARGGICYGLCITWIEAQLEKTGRRFEHDAAIGTNRGIFDRSQEIWASQLERHWVTEIGLEATSANGAKEMTFSPREEEDLRGFVRWMRASAGVRYFMIDTHDHQMAARGSKAGLLSFFDPNAGTVTTAVASRLAGCLHEFYNIPKVRACYVQTGKPQITATARKYKVA